ncbi:MAG: hypothetical protein ACKO5K_14270 [Armatimonadota bacterium]
MRLIWEVEDAGCEFADDETVRAAVRDAFDALPREHLRLLDAVTIFERDPRGRNLGIYLRDHRGNHIEIYLDPHCKDAGKAPARCRLPVLRLHVAHTLFHEVGHHMTLTVNKRMAPSRRRVDVEQTLEKWAETYVAKRMQAYLEKQRTGTDDDPHADAIAWLEQAVTGPRPTPRTQSSP